jgi:hypothetical protein
MSNQKKTKNTKHNSENSPQILKLDMGVERKR